MAGKSRRLRLEVQRGASFSGGIHRRRRRPSANVGPGTAVRADYRPGRVRPWAADGPGIMPQ